MFYQSRDASKVALLRLVGSMKAVPGALIDVQWATDHLQTLGAVEISRQEYLARLIVALRTPAISAVWGG